MFEKTREQHLQRIADQLARAPDDHTRQRLLRERAKLSSREEVDSARVREHFPGVLRRRRTLHFHVYLIPDWILLWSCGSGVALFIAFTLWGRSVSVLPEDEPLWLTAAAFAGLIGALAYAVTRYPRFSVHCSPDDTRCESFDDRYSNFEIRAMPVRALAAALEHKQSGVLELRGSNGERMEIPTRIESFDFLIRYFNAWIQVNRRLPLPSNGAIAANQISMRRSLELDSWIGPRGKRWNTVAIIAACLLCGAGVYSRVIPSLVGVRIGQILGALAFVTVARVFWTPSPQALDQIWSMRSRFGRALRFRWVRLPLYGALAAYFGWSLGAWSIPRIVTSFVNTSAAREFTVTGWTRGGRRGCAHPTVTGLPESASPTALCWFPSVSEYTPPGTLLIARGRVSPFGMILDELELKPNPETHF